MAHAIVTQVLLDGPRETIIKVTIKGDGSSGELAKAIVFNASSYDPEATSNALMDITYNLNSFSGELFWDATTDVALMSLATDHPYHECFFEEGGLVNNAGTGVTGDILLSTVGLAATSTDGYIVFHIKKRKTDTVI